MFLNGKETFDLKEDDLLSLINRGESEIKTLEFKRTLVVSTDADKKEFLADISSFANAAGGYIVYGMDAKDGIATTLLGMDNINLDETKLRIENIVREGISPRIPNIAIHPIQLKSGAHAIVLYIPKSWASPHIVWFQKSSKFFSRNSAGKYQLDIQEIRSAFLLSESLSNKIENFRLDRIGKVVANETPIPLNKGAKIVLHLIPVVALQSNNAIDISFAAKNYHLLQPIGGLSGARHNFDGFLNYCQFREGNAQSYIQLFRNGIVEIVDGYLLRDKGDQKLIPSVLYEKELMDVCARSLNFLHHLGIEPPIFVFHSLIGVTGYVMAVKDSLWLHFSKPTPIDRDILLLPEITIESLAERDISIVLRPMFDAVWNAAGWARSMNYDDNGKRIDK